MKQYYSKAFGNIFLILTILYSGSIFSQTGDEAFVQNHYSSPDSKISGGNNTSVDLYSGKLNVNIPIYEYTGRELNLPISMGYTAEGVKVEQLASCIGFGWNLNVGGRVNNVISGPPDERYANGVNFLDDKYSLALPGVTEYFTMEYYQPTANINPLIKAATRIGSPNTTPWDITMPDGGKYYFGYNDAIETHSTINGGQGSSTPLQPAIDVTTSWLLTKIVSKSGLDTYRFEYQKFIWSEAIPNKGNGYRYPSESSIVMPVSAYKVSQQMLVAIYHNDEKIIGFTYGPRNDLQFVGGATVGNKLTEIIFYNYKGAADTAGTADDPTIARKAVFDYEYFGPVSTSTYLQRKLKLKSMMFVGYDATNPNGLAGDKYQFDYDRPLETPPLTSYGQDYLGLYNGLDNNTNLLDYVDQSHDYPPFDPPTKRKFVFNKATIGTLTRITYPTKGYTNFEYEQNTLQGNFTHEIVPETVQTTQKITNLAAINVWVSGREWFNCTPPTPAYSTANAAMATVNFSQYGNGSVTNNNYVYTLESVKTNYMLIEDDAPETNYFIQTSGQGGVYLIQSVDDYTEAEVEIECLTTDQSYYYAYLRPTNSIVYTTDTNAQATIPGFIAGGITRTLAVNCVDTTPLPHLPPGNYQVTLWTYANPQEYFSCMGANIKIYKKKPVYTTIPEHPVHIDTRGELTDGFRIKSITNYASSNDFADRKEYKYNNGHLYHYINNQEMTTMSGWKKTSQGYFYSDVMFYNDVTEVQTDELGTEINGYTRYKFYEGDTDNFEYYDPWQGTAYNGLMTYNSVNNGTTSQEIDIPSVNDRQLREKRIYDRDGHIKRKEKYHYGLKYYLSTRFDPLIVQDSNNGWVEENTPLPCLLSTENTEYFGSSSVTKSSEYRYEEPPTKYSGATVYGIETSDNEIFSFDYYAYNTGGMTYAGYWDPTSGWSKNYAVIDGREVVSSETKYTNGGETVVTYKYDSAGNRVTSMRETPGTLTPASYECIIYGFSNRLPVAKITGKTYAEVLAEYPSLISQIKTAANVPVTSTSESTLRGYLETLRSNYPDYPVTTFTYDPMKGVTSMTDAKGYTMYYEYDALGRLRFTKHKDGSGNINILSENQYNNRAN